MNKKTLEARVELLEQRIDVLEEKVNAPEFDPTVDVSDLANNLVANVIKKAYKPEEK